MTGASDGPDGSREDASDGGTARTTRRRLVEAAGALGGLAALGGGWGTGSSAPAPAPTGADRGARHAGAGGLERPPAVDSQSQGSEDRAARQPRSGVVHPAEDGYVAVSERTGRTFRHVDAGVALQALVRELESANRERTGVVEIAPGRYVAGTEVRVLGRGLVLAGTGGWQAKNQAPVVWTGRAFPEGSTDRALFRFGDDDARGGEASVVRGLHLKPDRAGMGVYGVSADRLHVQDCTATDLPAGGNGIRIEGGSNCSVVRCKVANLAVVGSPISGDGTNTFVASQLIVNSNDAGTPAFEAAGDGWFVDQFKFNSYDTADLDVPLVTGAKRTRFSNGVCVVSTAPTMVDGPERCEFVNVRFVAGDVALRDPLRTLVTSCRFDGQGGHAIHATGTTKSVAVSSCEFRGTGGGQRPDGGAIQFDRRASAVDWSITGNVFRSVGARYDVAFGGLNHGTKLIAGNAMHGGVAENHAAFLDGDTRITDNPGYNPVGVDRPTPDRPSRGEAVPNDGAQPATVYQVGGTGVTVVDPDGTGAALPGDPGQFVVPAFGAARFDSSPPDEWLWYWH